MLAVCTDRHARPCSEICSQEVKQRSTTREETNPGDDGSHLGVEEVAVVLAVKEGPAQPWEAQVEALEEVEVGEVERTWVGLKQVLRLIEAGNIVCNIAASGVFALLHKNPSGTGGAFWLFFLTKHTSLWRVSMATSMQRELRTAIPRLTWSWYWSKTAAEMGNTSLWTESICTNQSWGRHGVMQLCVQLVLDAMWALLFECKAVGLTQLGLFTQLNRESAVCLKHNGPQ